MTLPAPLGRRRVLAAAGALGAVALACRRSDGDTAHEEPEVGAVEDLMREHGLVARVLLIYEAAADRLHEHHGVPASVLLGATEIVQDFVQGYHEQLEEDEVFPRFERRGELVDVVTTLRLQHMRGRAATQSIFEMALAGGTLEDPVGLEPPLRAFVRMYRPHAAREDTVVFPKLREWVQGHEYDELSERFERTEHERFGEHGFERMLARVAALEQELGLDQLAEFTA